MALAGGVPSRLIHEEYEALASEYRAHCDHGDRRSVLRTYEEQLESLREELRRRRNAIPLGTILLRLGAIDETRLAGALGVQQESGRKKLLGEVLVDLGWVDEDVLRMAVAAQASACDLSSGIKERVGTT